MKWLLITTLGTNPGDEFARIGVQNLIRGVDPSPEFDLLNKENPDHYTQRPFDRAIVCGMPLWWSTPEQDNYDIWWWDKIFNGWIAEDRRKFMILGAGHVVLDRIEKFSKYTASIDYAIRKSWAVSVREPVLDDPRIVDSVCPSAFSIQKQSSTFNLCNLMENGGHFPYPSEQTEWLKKEEAIVELLHASGYKFVAHNDAEHRLAHSIGWSDWSIFRFDTPEEYLSLYSRSLRYFGNRLHGAAVCAAMGIPTWGVAYDSRIGMVKRLGGHAEKPSEIRLDQLQLWLTGATDWGHFPTHHLELERFRLKKLLSRFMYD